MSIIGSNVLAGASGSGVEAYEIEQSLRFDASSYLTRTAGSSNVATVTLSFWAKKCTEANQNQVIISGGNSSNNTCGLTFNNGKFLTLSNRESGNGNFNSQPDAEYRDPSAWYHFVQVIDFTNSTQADRIRVYENGVRVSVFNFITLPTNETSVVHLFRNSENLRIGDDAQGASDPYPFNGYLAEFHCVDGSALDADQFGEYDDNGVWRPIEYTGSHGTEGFYLKFDPDATNGIGHDHSGNGNNFTATGFTTSGTGTDVMSDTPTTNWCTLNAVDKASQITLSNGNLTFVKESADSWDNSAVRGTFAVSSGKWYWEITKKSTTIHSMYGVALGNASFSENYGAPNNETWTYYSSNGNKFGDSDGGSGTSYGATFTNGDVIGIALDCDNGTLVFYKNGTSQGTAYSTLSGKILFPWVAMRANGTGSDDVNFGQREFDNPPGTVSATDYFNAVTYTGTGAEQSVTGCGFQPDLVWIKSRSNTHFHVLVDVVRGNGGSGSFLELFSNSNAGEQQYTGRVTSLDSDGFTVGTDSQAGVNTSSNTYVAWCWKAGGTASANTDGTLDSSVSANNDAGFSVVTYTGNGTSGATVGHGLSAAPSVIFVKLRETATDSNDKDWAVYHSSVDASAPEDYNLTLSSDAARSDSTGSWNDTAPSSSVFTVGNNFTVNNNGKDYVAYCWTDTAGVVKTGSYTGTGEILNFVDVGFRPAMVIVKRSDSTGAWTIKDTARGAEFLYANTNAVADSISASSSRFTNTGFYLDSYNNVSGGTYVYIAFAENFSADEDFKALNTANLPAPEIADGSDYFNTVLYSGNGTSQSLTVGFQPDWIWTKPRNATGAHVLVDAVRGNTKFLESNSNGAEQTRTGNDGVTSFDTSGYSIGSSADWNASSETFASWNWLAGNGTSSNTNGSITSTVSVNATAGFSIVSYTGTGSAATVGHGLGVAPSFYVVKPRSEANNWPCYHKDLTSANYYIHLNLNLAEAAASQVWNGTAPSSTVFNIGTNTNVNQDDATFIAYCFAEVESYSRIGSYVGNGDSTNGKFVYTGFKPAMVITKMASGTDNWNIYDSTRNTYNFVSQVLYPDLNNSEDTLTSSLDFLSNGFRPKPYANNSGATYIYLAFASSPFGGSGVSPATAR